MSSPDDHSNVLGRREGNSGLQQQGSIDWSRLSSSFVRLSVDFLVRLSNCGVEGVTVHAAQAVLSKMKLSSEGEKRVLEAVAHLPAFSSINKVLWFGFGIKHIIRHMVETDQGLNCVALCAALQEMYSTVDSAKIMRELLVLSGAPIDMTPSLKQWITLVELCGGALTSTDFGTLVHRISKEFLPQDGPALRLPSAPDAIANAISGLIAVSNGAQDQIKLLGGVDCAWIAAFAVWMLDLRVLVEDASGSPRYRSYPQSSLSPKVLILYGDPGSTSLQLIKRVFVVPSGDALIGQEYSTTQNGGLSRQANTLLCGRVPWKSLLKDTFGRPASLLIDGPLSRSCGMILGCVARIFNGLLSDDPDVPIDTGFNRYLWKFYNSSSHGRGFVNTARQQMPELAVCKNLMDAMEYGVNLGYLDALATFDQQMMNINEQCLCIRCMKAIGL